MITVTIWHSVALDGQGHQTGMLDGYQPGDPVVRVFIPGRPRRLPAEGASHLAEHVEHAAGRPGAVGSRSTCRGPADRGSARPVSGRCRARGRRAAGHGHPRSRTR